MSGWPYGIRPATIDDEDVIYNMLLELHEENGFFKVSETKVRDFIRSATGQQGGLIGVIGDKEPEASCGLEIGQWWYTDEWSLNEKWVFVRKEYRELGKGVKNPTGEGQPGHANRLIDWSKWCQKNLNIPLFMGIISTERTAAKERLYRRKMTPVGGMFMYANGHNVTTGAGTH